MCSIGIGLAVAGGVASIAGGIQQSRAAQQQANFRAAVARNNEIIAGRLAEDARARGVTAAAQVGVQAQVDRAKQAEATRQLIARQRVAQAGLGQLVDTGSALDLNVDVAATGKLEERILTRNERFEKQVIAANAEREAIGFLTQGANFAAEAQLLSLQAKAARQAGLIDTFGTVITTAGLVNDKWKPKKVPTLPSTFGTAEAIFS